MKKLITQLEYLWLRLKSTTPSLFNYANAFWIIILAVITYLKAEKIAGNLPEGWDGVVDNAYIITGIIGIILLKLPTKDRVLQSDLPVERKVELKKAENKETEL